MWYTEMEEGGEGMNIGPNQKVCIVTGAARGIGKAISERLLDASYAVIMVDRDDEAVTKAVKTLKGRNVISWEADVGKESDIAELFSFIAEEQMPLWGIVNNAGINYNRPISELTVKQWNRVMETNLTSVFLTAKYGSPLMKEGSIVNISSTRAFMSEANTEAYSASKGGILSLTHSLAVSLGPNIRVNAICPGWINCEGEKLTPEDHRQHPAGRVGVPDDIASIAAYLISPESGFITGEHMIIDGGMTRRMIYC